MILTGIVALFLILFDAENASKLEEKDNLISKLEQDLLAQTTKNKEENEEAKYAANAKEDKIEWLKQQLKGKIKYAFFYAFVLVEFLRHVFYVIMLINRE